MQEEPQRPCCSAEASVGFLDESLALENGKNSVSFDVFNEWCAHLTEVLSTFGLSHDLSKKMGATYDIPHGVSSVRSLLIVIAYF
jgi:hypothetical protein